MKVPIAQDRFDLRKVPVGRCDQTSQTHVGPNDGRVGMPLEDGFYLVEVGRFGFVFRNVLCDRDVDIIVQYDQQTNFGSEIEYAIESRVLKARKRGTANGSVRDAEGSLATRVTINSAR